MGDAMGMTSLHSLRYRSSMNCSLPLANFFCAISQRALSIGEGTNGMVETIEPMKFITTIATIDAIATIPIINIRARLREVTIDTAKIRWDGGRLHVNCCCLVLLTFKKRVRGLVNTIGVSDEKFFWFFSKFSLVAPQKIGVFKIFVPIASLFPKIMVNLRRNNRVGAFPAFLNWY